MTENKDDYANKMNSAAHRKGISPEQVVDYYTKWASEYEKHLDRERYKGPEYAAVTLRRVLGQAYSRSSVMDVAAGTGLLGVQLAKFGFHQIDAIEPSPGMLEEAKRKNVYVNCYCEMLGRKKTKLESDSYDALVLSGGMGEGHIPCQGLLEMARLVKPGGFVVIVMREKYLEEVAEYRNRLEPLMDKMGEKGIWRLVERRVVPNYSFDNNGLIYVFAITMEGSCDIELE